MKYFSGLTCVTGLFHYLAGSNETLAEFCEEDDSLKQDPSFSNLSFSNWIFFSLINKIY